jgi:lipopolysaccharide biosynthesis protein
MHLVFVNAWNEWAEGAYLEPDRRYGYSYLAETKAVVDRFTLNGDGPRLAVVAHLYYDDVWPEMRRSLYNIPEPFDLYVTIPPSLDVATRRQLRRDFPRLTMLELENRGRDILPFLKVLRRIGLSRYDLICKIHSKKTVHRKDGGEWREQALRAMLESPRSIDRILAMFGEHPEVAMVGPEGMVLQSTYYWGVGEQAVSNRRHVRALAARVGIDPGTADFHFVAGSMFWCRPRALGGLLELDVADREFEDERGQRDGTLAHAMERFLGLLVSGQGFSLGDTAGRRFEQVMAAGWPPDPDSVRWRFAHPTLDGEPL